MCARKIIKQLLISLLIVFTELYHKHKMSEDQFSEHPIAKKSKPVIPLKESRKNKICQICGDSSLGFNFGAISCESCKAFFRRNAGKLKVLHQNHEKNISKNY